MVRVRDELQASVTGHASLRIEHTVGALHLRGMKRNGGGMRALLRIALRVDLTLRAVPCWNRRVVPPTRVGHLRCHAASFRLRTRDSAQRGPTTMYSSAAAGRTRTSNGVSPSAQHRRTCSSNTTV